MTEQKKKIVVMGGGTVFHVRSHLSLSAIAYGTTAREISRLLAQEFSEEEYEIYTEITKMGDPKSTLETHQDIDKAVNEIIADKNVKVVVFNVALVDFQGSIGDVPSDKYATRLKSREGDQTMRLSALPKLIGRFRNTRKDIFLVGFKTTCGASMDEQYLAGLKLLKESSCNLVLANDTKTRLNMVITPEEAKYGVSTDRHVSLVKLRDLISSRVKNSTYLSTTMDYSLDMEKWDSLPSKFKKVMDFLLEKKAFKPNPLGRTPGHFGIHKEQTDPDKELGIIRYVCSMRKVDFNQIKGKGLLSVVYDTKKGILKSSGKPSVGVIFTQRKAFEAFPDMKYIVHFHCPRREDSPDDIRIQKQWPFECGTEQCADNTVRGMMRFGTSGNIVAVMLEKHGPNILFNDYTNVEELCQFIDRNFDLSVKSS